MLEEFHALQKQRTWSLMSLPPTKTAIGWYFLSQQKYAKDILLKAGLSACKPCSSPISVKPSTPPNASLPFDNPALYRSLVGALQYLTITRPDLSLAVNQACQHMHAPTVGHFAAVKRILRFVQGTLPHGLHYTPSTFDLHGFSDANWAGDIHDRKSISGYCVFLGNNLVSWSAKKQATVSRSSTEAEYRALAHTAAELSWLTMTSSWSLSRPSACRGLLSLLNQLSHSYICTPLQLKPHFSHKPSRSSRY
ncbi:hypothetical protein CsSME_00026569 [Camellia sinensis var. sinensis]